MAVGPAGTVNDTNAPPQNYGGVSPKQVEEFKEAVNRSTTSNDASGIQSSKGKHTSEHSHDTSKSLPIILATRPPINRGNPTGKQGAPLYDTQGAGSNAGQQVAKPPLATPKYETRGLVGELDPNYDAEAWENDEGNRKVQIKNPTGDTRLDNLARSAAHKARLQDGMNGAKTDMMVKGSDGKIYQMSVRYNGTDTSVEFTAMKRASDGKDVATMTNDMAAKGITVGKGFSQDELAAIYDGFATMKGKDLAAMNGVTLEKGTRKELKGTDLYESGAYGNKKITFYKEAFEAGMVGNLPKAGATFLHEAGHRFLEVSGSLDDFQKTKGHADDITPYGAASEKLSQQTKDEAVKVDPKQEHYAEAYMLYRSDPKFMEQNYPQLFKFFEGQTK
jgi:hypothetical protein